MHILVVRHGQPNDEAETGGDGDPPLSELGLQQAQAIGDFLAGETVDHVVASPMVRAHQTALPLCEHLGITPELDDRLKEAGWDAGKYVRSEENMGFFIDGLAKDPNFLFRPEGREAFFARINAAFADIAMANAGRTVAVFCHGMVTAALVTTILGNDDPMAFSPTYTGLTRVQASSAGDLWSVRSFNESMHLRA